MVAELSAPAVLFWGERVGGWWTDLPRRCPSCTGPLEAEATLTGVPGRVVCLQCAVELATVRDTRPPSGYAHLFRPTAVRPPARVPRPAGAVVARKRRRRQSSATYPCADCGRRSIGKERTRCQVCHLAHMEPATLQARLLGLLAKGQMVQRAALCAALGISRDPLRQKVMKLRLNGHDIVYVDGGYRLEGEAP